MPPQMGIAIPLTIRTNPGALYNSPSASWEGASGSRNVCNAKPFAPRLMISVCPPAEGGNAHRINNKVIITQYFVSVNIHMPYFAL